MPSMIKNSTITSSQKSLKSYGPSSINTKNTNNHKTLYTFDDLKTIYNLPFLDLIHKAAKIHRLYHDPKKIQLSQLLSIKTGGCKEDCKYCPQSAHNKTNIKHERLWNTGDIVKKAKIAKKQGATRFCMGAAWSRPPSVESNAFKSITTAANLVKNLGLEVCMTLGMLNKKQAIALAENGVDYYNHNLDTSREYYKKIVTTRCYDDRINTLNYARENGMKLCCGGIIGMKETVDDRLKLLLELQKFQPAPESVPINSYVKVDGTPLDKDPEDDNWQLIKMIALTRIVLGKSMVRLSAGRKSLSDSEQALCFLAGANSIFVGEKLLTTKNCNERDDYNLLKKLGLN